MRRAVHLVSVLMFLALGFAACGPPTMEGQVSRYQSTIDKLDGLATKQPALKQGIDAKKVEFANEFAAASAKSGEDGVNAMIALNRRMDSFVGQIAPAPATNTQPGSKLGGTGSPGTPAPGGAATPAPGGKLGGAGAAPMTPPPSTGGKLGGDGAAPMTPPPSTGGKLGGAAPAPAAQPAQPAADPGFGGK